MSGKFDHLWPKDVPKFKAAESLPKYDIKKGQEMLDMVSKAFENTYGPSSSSQLTSTQRDAPYPSAASSVPRVPSNNRYAGHDQVVALIAKNLIDAAFTRIQAHQWTPVSQKTLGAYYRFEVKVQPDHIYLLGSGLGTCEAYFVNYGMRSIPDTTAFIYAVEPAMKQYLNESARAKFGNIHRLSDYYVSGGSYTYNGRVYMEFKIEQYFYPDRNLKSW